MKYTCNCCGQEHDEWPALTYSSPSYYHDLSDDDKKNIAKLDSDFCVINNSDQIDRFIRCTMTQKIIDYCDNLEYGLWVSLSEKSFQDYIDNFDNDNHKTQYFGWLSNVLPDYNNTLQIPTTVFTKKGNSRPEIVPHIDYDHPLVKDYYNGIDKSEAERRINNMLKSIGQIKE